MATDTLKINNTHLINSHAILNLRLLKYIGISGFSPSFHSTGRKIPVSLSC